MNSWKSSRLGACTPPLSTLKCGTGSDGVTPDGVSHCHSGIPAEAASARASAMEVPTVALAPSRLLFAVPSRSIMAWSASASEVQGRPHRRSRISVLTAATAPRTPLPSYLSGSPSRRSTASREPVEAPDGTPARAAAPSASRTVTARVGRPRESRISRADRSTTSNVAIICSCPGAAPLGPPLCCADPDLLAVPGRGGRGLGPEYRCQLGTRALTARVTRPAGAGPGSCGSAIRSRRARRRSRLRPYPGPARPDWRSRPAASEGRRRRLPG